MRKLRLAEVKKLAPSYPAGQWWSQSSKVS